MSSNMLQLDDHKLLYHLPVLTEWQLGKIICPITVSIGPSRACNFRCVFCAYAFLDRKPIYLDLKKIERLAGEMAGKGTKSFFFSGDGEPLMHRSLPDCIVNVKSTGIDTALNTNGVLLSRDISETILPAMSWIRISVNAGASDTYAQIHGTTPDMFEKVLGNLADAVAVKKDRGLGCTIGIQSLILSENLSSLILLAKMLREIGVDYFALKPFLHHPDISYSSPVDYKSVQVREVLKELESVSTDTFKVIVRWQSLEKIVSRTYDHCLSFPFFMDIDSNGDVYPCGPKIGHPEFCYGNINTHGFSDIWENNARQSLEKFMTREMDCAGCMPNCRNDAVNRFLWRLRQAPAHVNFI